MDQVVQIRNRIRMLVIPWLVLTIITGSSYKTILILFLTFPSTPDIPHTFHQLASRKDCDITINVLGSVETLFFQNSDNPDIRQVNARMQKLDDDDKACIHGAVLHPKTACICWVIASSNSISRFTLIATTKRTNAMASEAYMISKELTSQITNSIPFQKDSVLVDSFGPIIGWLFDFGIYEKWNSDIVRLLRAEGLKNYEKSIVVNGADKETTKFYKKLDEIAEESANILNQRPLRMQNLIVAFFILIGVVGAAGVVWILEIIVWNFNCFTLLSVQHQKVLQRKSSISLITPAIHAKIWKKRAMKGSNAFEKDKSFEYC